MLRKALFLLLVLFVIGCGGRTSLPSRTTSVAFSVDLTSIFKVIKSYNNGAVTAGWNQLTGTTTVNGSAATVELLANVNYANGSGPFFGFVTITLPDTSALTLKMNGQALLNSGSGTTAFSSTLSTVGGSGSYASTVATGSFTGSRSSTLGSPVHLDFLLHQ